MTPPAPRQPLRLLWGQARGALMGLGCVAAFAGAVDACGTPPWAAADVAPGSVVRSGDGDAAWYSQLSDRYGHAVLGDALEPTLLHFRGAQASGGCGVSVAAGPDHVFEDIAPRLVDVDADGQSDIIVVRSHFQKGGQLVIYTEAGGELRPLAMTPYIGTRFRWLAPAGAADFDGDGQIEIAYVDRPHLAKTLRIWRYTSDDFREIATLRGLTNHRIGEDFITGGVRDCGNGPEMILVDAAWQNVMMARLTATTLSATAIGTFGGQGAVARAMACEF